MSRYSKLVTELGEEAAREEMKRVASKRTVFHGGSFKDPEIARQAQLKSAETRKRNNTIRRKRGEAAL